MTEEATQRRLLRWLLVASLVLNVMYAALVSVLVPAQLAKADEANKEVNLAIVMTASSLLTMVVHPLAGALSDRTQSRWGRRAPWIVGGAIASAIAITTLGSLRSVVAVGIGWLLVQPLLNVLEAALDAVLPDRVPSTGRPRASASYGAGAAAGLAVGAVVAGALVASPQIMTLGLAAALVLTMVAFVVRNPEHATTPRVSLPLRRAWSSRNLQLVFAGRILLVLGSQMVLGYLLYIIMEFTGRNVDDAAALVPLLVGVHLLSLVAGAIIGVRWARANRVKSVVSATLVVAGGLLIPLIVPSLLGLVIYAVIAGVGRGAYLTADLALMMDVLPSTGNHGRDFGVLGLATVLPQTLAPSLVAGLLILFDGEYVVIFVAACLGALLSILFIRRVQLPVPGHHEDLVGSSDRGEA